MRNPVTFAILGAVCAGGPVAAGNPTPPIMVLVRDYAYVPDAALAAGKGQAQSIMRAAGVEVKWLDFQPDAPDPLTFVIDILPQGSTRWRAEDSAFGLAVTLDSTGVGYFASVFYDRVQELAPLSPSSALGHVIAHELGHLLLGSGAHGPSGIMKANWGPKELQLAAQRHLKFQDSERRRLVDNLRRRSLALQSRAR